MFRRSFKSECESLISEIASWIMLLTGSSSKCAKASKATTACCNARFCKQEHALILKLDSSTARLKEAAGKRAYVLELGHFIIIASSGTPKHCEDFGTAGAGRDSSAPAHPDHRTR